MLCMPYTDSYSDTRKLYPVKHIIQHFALDCYYHNSLKLLPGYHFPKQFYICFNIFEVRLSVNPEFHLGDMHNVHFYQFL